VISLKIIIHIIYIAEFFVGQSYENSDHIFTTLNIILNM